MRAFMCGWVEMLPAGFSVLVHEQVTELRGRHPLGTSLCIPSGSPLVTTYVHDQLPEVLLFSIVRTFYSRQVQAPAVNYIRKTFRVRLNTSCIPGFVPIRIELNNEAKRGSCVICFGHVFGSHLI